MTNGGATTVLSPASAKRAFHSRKRRWHCSSPAAGRVEGLYESERPIKRQISAAGKSFMSPVGRPIGSFVQLRLPRHDVHRPVRDIQQTQDNAHDQPEPRRGGFAHDESEEERLA